MFGQTMLHDKASRSQRLLKLGLRTGPAFQKPTAGKLRISVVFGGGHLAETGRATLEVSRAVIIVIVIIIVVIIVIVIIIVIIITIIVIIVIIIVIVVIIVTVISIVIIVIII